MPYFSTNPARPLGDFVERFWQISDSPPHSQERIIPSGTVELVINLREDELRIYSPTHPNRCKRFSGALGIWVTICSRIALIALDSRTGTRLWHFQEIPHDLCQTRPVYRRERQGGRASPMSRRLCSTATPRAEGWAWVCPERNLLMDDFDIVSKVGVGTTITMKKWVRGNAR